MEVKNPPNIRVVAFIDGFNLYHAIDKLGRDHLKWINLRRLMEIFIQPDTHVLTSVYLFTATPEWLVEPAKRHKAFIQAQAAHGVTPVLGSFKAKNDGCNSCGHTWIRHEEKQTDVNMAIWLVQDAFNDRYDQAIVVTQDADLTPALRLVSELPKKRKIKVISPPGLHHSKELGQYAKKRASIKPAHLEQCLLPREVIETATGRVAATRPIKYDPPA